MEIIAMGEMRAYLKENLYRFKEPVIFISSDFIPGCPKCNSSATVYYCKIVERSDIPTNINAEKATNHKFPIDVIVNYPVLKGRPKQFVIGTKNSAGKLQMILRRVIE